MGHTVDEAAPVAAAPRHVRKRTFHGEIPDALLVPGVHPAAAARSNNSPGKRIAYGRDSKESDFQRKRRVALFVVVAVSLSIPALLVALILAG